MEAKNIYNLRELYTSIYEQPVIASQGSQLGVGEKDPKTGKLINFRNPTDADLSKVNMDKFKNSPAGQRFLQRKASDIKSGTFNKPGAPGTSIASRSMNQSMSSSSASGTKATPSSTTASTKPIPTNSSSATASTADKIAGGMKVYDAQRKSGDMKGAAETGMNVSKMKYGDQLKPKTPNPLMQKTFGYQTGNAPDQQKARADKIIQSGAVKALAPSSAGTSAAKMNPSSITKTAFSSSTPALAKPLSTSAATAATTKPVDTITPAQSKIAASPKPIPMGSKKPGSAFEEVEVDNFDIILEHLVAEGYADTNENALVIMANMSEGWRESILEADSLEAMRARREKRLKAQRKREGRTSDGGDFGHDYYKPHEQAKKEREERMKKFINKED